ncbi:MAG TPA: ROK family transcriptional regulator [Burkholderiaceae bacterium]|nr:ROK family transcriptional regulator [Burkholderiaceae bacterium]
MVKAGAEGPTSRSARTQRRRHGSNQVGLGQFNERVVLHAIRVHGATPKADLARLTRLSTQTVSLIINRLLDEGLVLKRGRVRGRIGQPSVPIALNPSGAYSIGVKIGRRSLDVLMVDFTGRICSRSTMDYAFPDPDRVFDEVGARVEHLRQSLPPDQRRRIVGVGVAAPLSLGGWQALLQIGPDQAERWNQTDIRARVQQITGLPTEFAKDTAAACVAELVAGRGQTVDGYVYLFVDTFIGGGLVIDGHLHSGIHGNAGAVASMPLGLAVAGAERPAQLLSAASLWTLEQRFAAAGLDTTAVNDARALKAPWSDETNVWLMDAARAIALAITASNALLDLDGAIIDGSCDRELLARLLAEVDAALGRYDGEGMTRPQLLAGSHGGDARALGGALLPLYARFSPDRNVFTRDDAGNVAIEEPPDSPSPKAPAAGATRKRRAAPRAAQTSA